MSEASTHQSFVEKWRGRWPEWALAEVFVPSAQRASAAAWFALLQEFADAAWSSTDPAPGLAKLAWWQEELRGWAKGARRHPLGVVLQPTPAPWAGLADALPVLRHRELPARPEQAMEDLRPLAQACAVVEAELFGAPSAPEAAAMSLLAGAAVLSGGAGGAAAVLRTWPSARVPALAVRVHACLLRLRLQQAAGDGRWAPVPRWRSLWGAWRAARN
jgi:phytoene/squalene synthetase